MLNQVNPGSPAPAVVLGALADPDHPRVLAFLSRGWRIELEHTTHVAAIRAELRGLGAELVVVSDTGVWAFRPDDPVESCGPCSPHDIAALRTRYGIQSGCEAIFVIDGRSVIRFAHRAAGALETSLHAALRSAGEAMLTRLPQPLFNRREWNLTALVAGLSVAFLGCRPREKAKERPAAAPIPDDVTIALDVNGQTREVRIDTRTSLLDALRERMGLTGTKKGCDLGQCGACTVLVDGRRVLSCLMLAVMAQGAKITTIEGLDVKGDLHPMQQAFLEQDGLQCGYCTPGQIMSAVALLDEVGAKDLTDAQVRERMSGNLCRCGAYPNIVAAIQSARRAGS